MYNKRNNYTNHIPMDKLVSVIPWVTQGLWEPDRQDGSLKCSRSSPGKFIGWSVQRKFLFCHIGGGPSISVQCIPRAVKLPKKKNERLGHCPHLMCGLHSAIRQLQSEWSMIFKTKHWIQNFVLKYYEIREKKTLI